MAGEKTSRTPKRSYPPFWEVFIPIAVAVIGAMILFLIYITVRVALGLPSLPF